MGIISTLKIFAPIVIYIIGLGMILLCISGRVKWALLLITALIPLRNVVERLQAYPLGKDFIDILIFFVAVGWVSGAIFRREKFLERNPLNWICLLIVIYSFISLIQGSFYLNLPTILSTSDPRVQNWKNFCVLPFLFFLTFNNVKEEKWVWRTVLVICATMVVMDYYLVQQISWYHNLVSRNKINGTFFYLGPNEVAAFYNQYTIILMSLFFSMKKSRLKLPLLALILTNLYCILFLFSRGAYLGLCLGMFFLFAVKKKALLVPLLFVVILWQAILPERVIERISETTNETGEFDASVQRRINIWNRSLELFGENPVTGIGYDVFPHLGFDLGDTHNMYLRMLSEQGIIGFFLIVILLFIFLKEGLKLYRRGTDELSRGLGLGFALCIIVLVVNNIFGNRWSYMEVSSNLWIFAGLVSRMRVLSSQPNQEKFISQKNSQRKKKTDTLSRKYTKRRI